MVEEVSDLQLDVNTVKVEEATACRWCATATPRTWTRIVLVPGGTVPCRRVTHVVLGTTSKLYAKLLLLNDSNSR